MSFSDHELETDAIDKCSRSLEKLDNRAKVRVLRYLVERFGLAPPASSQPAGGVTQNINFQQNNVVLPSPSEIPTQLPESNRVIILPSEAIIKKYIKSESDLLILLAYHVINKGQQTFTRSDLQESYRTHNVYNDSRKTNFTRTFESLTKKSWITALNNDDFAITDDGSKAAEAIMSGKSVDDESKPTRRRVIKKSAPAKVEPGNVDVSLSQPIINGQA